MVHILESKTQASSLWDAHFDYEKSMRHFLLEQLARFCLVSLKSAEPCLARSYLLLWLTLIQRLTFRSKSESSVERAYLSHLGTLSCRFLLFWALYRSLLLSHFDR